jgi:hypothetical protein
MAKDMRAEMAKRLRQWRLLPNGDVAYLPYIESAVCPIDIGVALAIRFEARRTGPNDKTPEQFQFGLSPQQCRRLASQLIEAADFYEKDTTPPSGKPN